MSHELAKSIIRQTLTVVVERKLADKIIDIASDASRDEDTVSSITQKRVDELSNLLRRPLTPTEIENIRFEAQLVAFAHAILAALADEKIQISPDSLETVVGVIEEIIGEVDYRALIQHVADGLRRGNFTDKKLNS